MHLVQHERRTSPLLVRAGAIECVNVLVGLLNDRPPVSGAALSLGGISSRCAADACRLDLRSAARNSGPMTRRTGLILAAILAAVIVGLLYLRMHIGLPEGSLE